MKKPFSNLGDLMYIMQAVNDTRVFVTTCKTLDEAIFRVASKHPGVTIDPKRCIGMKPTALLVIQTGALEDVGVGYFPGNRDHSKPVPRSEVREDPAHSARTFAPLNREVDYIVDGPVQE